MKKKNQYISRFVLILCILFLLNILSTKCHYRLDLTQQKRFSLSKSTQKMLGNLQDAISIKILLKGNFPAGIKRLSETAEDIVLEFKEYGGRNIQYELLNPLEGKTQTEQKSTNEALQKIGVNPIKLQVQLDENDGGYSEKICYPYCVVSLNGKEKAINLLENHLGMNPLEELNYSESLIEYKLASAIKQLNQPDKIEIAYLVGNNEMLGYNTIDMCYTLSNMYKLDTLVLSQQIEISPRFAAVIICKPTSAFSEMDKFKIDQYIMNGGKVLWLMDMLNANLDSLRNASAFLATSNELNLEDLLFKYGVRINPDFVQDIIQCNPIPITVGNIGNSPDIRLFPWLYFPFSIPISKHPIVNNMDAISTQFCNSIDTISSPEIHKTFLLQTSNHSRKVPSPVRVTFSELKFQPKVEMFTERNIPYAVLLEGKFSSLYSNRLDPKFEQIYRDSLHKAFKPECTEASKMIVVADGDIFANDFTNNQGPYECGYYRFTKKLFANKTFILNCLEYLIDNDGLIEARSKELALNLLDGARIKKQRFTWQLLNIVLPILVVLFFGSGYFFFRRKKYQGITS